MNLRTVGIVTKPKRPEVARVASDLIDWFATRHIEAFVDSEAVDLIHRPGRGLPGEMLAERVDLVVVVGGDGTLLAAARLLAGRPVPILAINYGGLGFLTEVTLAELYPALELLREGKFTTEKRMMIEAGVWRGRDRIAFQRALNDVVINKGALARIIELETRVDGQYVSTFRSDGLVIATPTGSTAYNMSAGGPIVFPSMSAMLMTPICSHTLTNRPILLPADVNVDVIVKSTEDVYLTVDGQVGLSLQAEDRASVRKSSGTVELVVPANANYFDILRGKLKWG